MGVADTVYDDFRGTTLGLSSPFLRSHIPLGIFCREFRVREDRTIEHVSPHLLPLPTLSPGLAGVSSGLKSNL